MDGRRNAISVALRIPLQNRQASTLQGVHQSQVPIVRNANSVPVPLDEQVIDATNSPIPDHLLQDIIFCPFNVELQDDVVEYPRVLPETTRKVDGSHPGRVRGIEGPKATVLPRQFVPEKGTPIAVVAVQEEVLEPVSIMHRRLNETMLRQIRITCRIQIIGFERDHPETTVGIEIFDEAPYRATVVPSTIYKYVPTPRNDTLVAHRIGPRICDITTFSVARA